MNFTRQEGPVEPEAVVVPDRALHRTASTATVASIGMPAGASRAARLPRLRKALNPEKTRSGLRDQAALLAAAIEALPDGVLLLDLTDKELAYNRKLAEMWHIPGWGSRHSALIHMAARAREPRAFLARIREGSTRPGAESHAFVELTNGRIMEFYSAPQRINGTRTGTVFSFRDVTGAKRTEAHLRHCAFHDSLTGLPNRALLIDRINQAIAQAHRHQTQLALLFIDLDRFKCVNDAHGHHAGDRVLLETGKRLQGCVRHEDTAARLGGDEFVVLLTEVTKGGDAARVAIKVLRALSAPFVVAGHQVLIGASIGISLFPDHGGNVETLLARADDAMHRAKGSGHASYRTFRLVTKVTAAAGAATTRGRAEL